MGRRKYVSFATSLVFAGGEHKDASLVERYRLDVNQLNAAAGLPELLRAWVQENLVEGGGIRYRDHSLKFRLDRYACGRPVLRHGQWRHADRLADDDLACIRNITAWFRRIEPSGYQIVEVGFNRHVQICKMAMNVALPTGNVLFLAIGVDRGLKTFFVCDRAKEGAFSCGVPGCKYTTARELFLKTVY